MPGLWGPLSSLAFYVPLEDTQDPQLGLLSWFQDGCKALPVLPLLSSCLSLPAQPLPRGRGAGCHSPGELLPRSRGLAGAWIPCPVSPHRVLPMPSCPRSSRLSCGMEVGCAVRIPPPVGPSAVPEHGGKGGGCLVVTQLCAPQLRWSPYWGTRRGALHRELCLPVSVKLHGWAVS